MNDERSYGRWRRDNKNDILQKDAGNNMNLTCEQQRRFRQKECKKDMHIASKRDSRNI